MIELRNITLAYDPSSPLISDANITINRGELVALLGRNGAGKSSLMRAIASLAPISTGSIILDGVDISSMSEIQRATTISLVTTERIRVANLSCEKLVALGRTPYTNWIGRLSSTDRDIVATALERVAMSQFANTPCDTLSDGELQRIMIARAIAQQSPILMLDEPTAFLDMPSRYDLMRLLRSLAHDENKTIIFSTHELDLARDSADKLLILDSPHLHLTPTSTPLINQIFATTHTSGQV